MYKHNDELLMPDTIFEEDHPRIISAKFGWDWLSSFRGEFFLNFIPTFFWFAYSVKIGKSSKLIKKNLLLWNYWANLNQILLKWSLGGPLSKLCPSAPSCI
jgi:hypothetical protein